MKRPTHFFICLALAFLFVLHEGIARAQDAAPVKGYDAAEVTFGDDGGVKGFFVHVGDKNWNQLDSGRSVVSSFVEYGRDEWSVYLRDTSGSATVHLDLWTKTVTRQSGGTASTLGKVLSAANTVAAAPPQPTANQDQGVPGCRPPQCLVGEVVLPSCPEGQRRGAESGICVPEVFFHSEAGLSLGAAQTKCVQNGWVLATAEEVQAAWETLNFDAFAFGMLADGRFAVPVQDDHANFKHGANIGAQGGNQGFFYVRANAVARTQEAPGAAPVTESFDCYNEFTRTWTTCTKLVIPVSGPKTIEEYYAKMTGLHRSFTDDDIGTFQRLRYTYSHGVPNFMQTRWADENYGPILDAALKRYIAEKFGYLPEDNSYMYDYLKAEIQNLDPNCLACRVTRYEFIGFFVPEYLNMLRTGTNPTLRTQFAEYVGYNLAAANRKTLDAWARYSRRSSAYLKDEPYVPGEYFQDGPTLIEPAILDDVPYKPNTLSIIADAVPLPGKSVADFKQCCMASPFTPRLNQEMLVELLMPVAAQAYPEIDGLDKRLLDVPDYLYKNVANESQALNIAGSIGIRVGTSAGIGGAVLFGATLGQLVASASSVASSLTTASAASAAVAAEGTVQSVAQTFTVFSEELGSHALGTAVGSAIGPILIGVAVFAAGFINTGGKAIELAIFEDGLKRDSYYTPREVDWTRMSDQEKVVNFGYLLQMLVLDAPGLTITVPEKKADVADQKLIEQAAVAWGRQNKPGKASLYDQVISTLDARYPH